MNFIAFSLIFTYFEIVRSWIKKPSYKMLDWFCKMLDKFILFILIYLIFGIESTQQGHLTSLMSWSHTHI